LTLWRNEQTAPIGIYMGSEFFVGGGRLKRLEQIFIMLGIC